MLLSISACGEKVPVSEAAKRVGSIPKNTLDKATGDVRSAIEKGEERNRQADEGRN